VQRAAQECCAAIVEAASVIADSIGRGGSVLVCGNGGSAADSQHFAAELVSCLDKHRQRRALSAIALTTDTSILTAIGNDFGFDRVFARQVEALGREGDVLICITTSGNSENLLAATDAARDSGLACVAITGGDGGKIRPAADVAIVVPGDGPGHVQEAQLAIEHLIATLVERRLAGPKEEIGRKIEAD